MNKSAKHLIIASSLLAGLCATGETSHAETMVVPARSTPNPSTCFSLGPDFVINVCATMQTLYLPIHVPWALFPPRTFSVSAYGASPSNNVGCLVRTVSFDGGIMGATSRKWLDQFGSTRSLQLGSLALPVPSSYSVDCQMYPGGRVYSAMVSY